jgi:hypothetical protein
MAASNTRFTQNSLGQSKTPIDSDHGIYRDPPNGGTKNPTKMGNKIKRDIRSVLGHPLFPETCPR